MNLGQVDRRRRRALIVSHGGEVQPVHSGAATLTSHDEIRMPNDTHPTQARRGPYADIAPALDEITQEVLFGDVWERPGLSKRDRSLITVATLVALYRTNELPFHLKRALENGVTKDELVELITHLAFYAGWPPASTAVAIARQVLPTWPSEELREE